MTQEYKTTIKQLVLNEETFLRLTLKGVVRGKEIPWRHIIVRPVLLKQHRHLQFSYFDAKQDITKNYRGKEAEEKLDEVLTLPFSSIGVQTTLEDVHVQITKEGKAIFSRTKPSSSIEKPNLSHDLKKDLPLPADKPDAFLQTIG